MGEGGGDGGVRPVLALTPDFDPDAAAEDGSGLFGLPSDPEKAFVHVIPVPFDATTSYRKGAARGPEAILRASRLSSTAESSGIAIARLTASVMAASGVG